MIPASVLGYASAAACSFGSAASAALALGAVGARRLDGRRAARRGRRRRRRRRFRDRERGGQQRRRLVVARRAEREEPPGEHQHRHDHDDRIVISCWRSATTSRACATVLLEFVLLSACDVQMHFHRSTAVAPTVDNRPVALVPADQLPGAALRAKVVRPAGLEPATPGLGNRCSILLSYGRAGKRLILS